MFCAHQFIKVIAFIFIYVEVASCRKERRGISCEGKERSTSFLWTMQRNPPVHFFGTIHVPYTQVWNYIPDKSKEAFKESENVYFELDLTDADTVAALKRCQMLPGGTDLRKVLPPDLYQRVKNHLKYVKSVLPRWLTSEQKGKGRLYADMLYDAIVGNWEQKKPIWVMLMINSLTKADMRSRGTPVLDLHLAWLAESLGKDVGAVEKVDEQCQPLNGLNLSQVLFALNHTLMMQEELRHGRVQIPYTTDDLIEQYNCGGLDSVMFSKESSQIPQMTNATTGTYEEDLKTNQNETDMIMATNIDSYFKNELIYRRNKRMAERVKVLLKENPDKSFFFAFGAGHFLGNGSVIDFLQQDGYKFVHDQSDSALAGKNSYRRVNRKNSRRQRKAKKNNNSRKRKKGRRQQRKKRDREMKGRQRVLDLWKRLENRDSAWESSHRAQGMSAGYNFYSLEYSQPEVRVINRFPTVFPPDMFEDWTEVKNQNEDNSLLESWSYVTSGKSKIKRDHQRNSRLKKTSLNSDLDILSYKLWSETYSGYENAGQSTFSVNVWSIHGLKCFILAFLSILLTSET